ncbi:MAG: DNRLRE domain-containing protein [Polyangiaceae bacterium]|nr:DNRLRE domain-containing protein [Polyangiaceae bacterium]
MRLFSFDPNRWLLAAAMACVLTAPGCARQARVCATSAACGDGSVCFAGQCRKAKAGVVPLSSQRVVLEPIDVSVVSSRRSEINSSYVSFGKKGWGDVVVLMRFPAPFSDSTRVVSAHLVMDPPPGSTPGPSPVGIRIARVVDPWESGSVTWGTLPTLSSPSTMFWVSSWGGRSLRVDVTGQVRRWREQRGDDHGIALRSAAQNEIGETYSLGTGDGRGPRLDVYVR